jgi:hypothetical protein
MTKQDHIVELNELIEQKILCLRDCQRQSPSLALREVAESCGHRGPLNFAMAEGIVRRQLEHHREELEFLTR